MRVSKYIFYISILLSLSLTKAHACSQSGKPPVNGFTGGGGQCTGTKNFTATYYATPPTGVADVIFYWNFGDGTLDTTSLYAYQNTHTYADTGYYIVTLIKKNPYGSDTTKKTIHVAYYTPKAGFTYTPTQPCIGGAIQFMDTSSINKGSAIIKWDWDFGDGTTAVIQNPIHSYASPGAEYTVSLTVTNVNGCTSSISNVIKIPWPKITQRVIGPYTVCQSATNVNYHVAYHNGSTYTWSVIGGAQTAGGNSNSISVNWSTPGIGIISVREFDLNGCGLKPAYDTIQIIACSALLPIADFSLSNAVFTSCLNPAPDTYYTYANVPLDLNDLSLNHPSSWNWTLPGATPSVSPEQNPTVIYPAPGSYTITLTVSNPSGTSSPVIKYLIVLAAPANLVPNPSFETYSTCPSTYGQITYASPWFQPTIGSSDYFNSCSPGGTFIGSVGVPQNAFGYQYARTGNAYAGGFVYQKPPYIGFSYREYIEAPLTKPLIACRKYYIEFYANLADAQQIGTDNLGAYLSSGSITSANPNGIELAVTPQIKSPNGVPVTDKDGWVKISGVYTAMGGENHITIGSFVVNTAMDTVDFGSGNNTNAVSYYYWDDVAVYDISPQISFPDTTICKGGSAKISACGGTSYSWSPGSGLNSPSAANPIASPVSSTTYTVSITNGGCISHDTIKVNVVLPLTSSKNISICNGSTFILPGGRVVSSTGSYIDTLAAVTGCDSIITTNLTVNPAISVSTTATNPTCSGGTNGSVLSNPSGGTPQYTYSWSAPGSQTAQIITGLSAGNYSVMITDSKGCTSVSAATIISPAPLVGQFTKGTASCAGCGCKEWLMVNATGGTSPYSYTWSDGYVNRYKNQLCPGAYSITIKDKNNCNMLINLTAP